MRLGKDVLEADLYGLLGVRPDAPEAAIRAAYRRQIRTSHPDLNPEVSDAASRTARLNVAAKVLLDPALRRTYDRFPRSKATPVSPPRPEAEWFERGERSRDDDWAAAPAPPRCERKNFASFFRDLRGREARLSLQVHELVESLSREQQLGFAALLVLLALGCLVWAQPRGFVTGEERPTSASVGAVYP